MGEAEVVWEGVLERGGVTLRKSLEDPVRNPPMAKYELQSTRESPVAVRIVEKLPDALNPENVGFVSSARRTEGWRIDGDRLVYEATQPAGESLRSAIAARGEAVEVIRELAAEPLEFEVGDTPSEHPPEPSQEPSDADGFETGSIARALAAEVRAGEVPAEDLADIRSAFGPPLGSRRVDERIEQLQVDVADLRAARRSLVDGLETIEQRLDSVEQTTANDDAISDLQEDIADMETKLYRLEKTLNAHTADLRSLERSVERLEEKLPEDLDAVVEFATQMRRAVKGFDQSDESNRIDDT
ncbi:MAG: hypothetical protein ABEH64_05845 [Salinirussus sp.]